MTYNPPALPTNIDATYPDRSPGDTAHQQYHDAIHGAFADLNAAGGVATGTDLAAASAPAWTSVTGKPTTFAPIVGTTGTTAKAGNYAPAWTDVTAKPTTFAPIVGTTGTTAKAGNYAPSSAEILTAAAANTLGGAEKVATGLATTGTVTMDCSASSWFPITPTGNITLAFSNVTASGLSGTFTVEITMGSTLRTVTYPSGTKHSGGAPVAPVVSKTLLVTIATRDGGTTWLASEALFS